jgi:serine/threonine-protein phosphatase 2A regulatory subunit A
MLTELIDKIDCHPELMMALGEQLGNLSTTVLANESSKCISLMTPLEMIAGSDDAIVRDKAIEALNKVSQKLPTIQIENNYLEMCKKLKKTDMYASRIAASQLYANVYPRLVS